MVGEEAPGGKLRGSEKIGVIEASIASSANVSTPSAAGQDGNVVHPVSKNRKSVQGRAEMEIGYGGAREGVALEDHKASSGKVKEKAGHCKIESNKDEVVPKIALIPTHPPKPSSFWTACNGCKMKFEYPRDLLQQLLRCHNCKEAFLGLELPARSKEAQSLSTQVPSHRQQLNVVHRTSQNWKRRQVGAKMALMVGEEAPGGKVRGSKKRGVTKASIADSASVSTPSAAGQDGNVVHPASKNRKRAQGRAETEKGYGGAGQGVAVGDRKASFSKGKEEARHCKMESDKDEAVSKTILITPSPPKPSTFWTACSGCKVEFEYPRDFLQKKLLCSRCKEEFLALELPARSTEAQSLPIPMISHQQQLNVVHPTSQNWKSGQGGAKMALVVGDEAPRGKVSGSKKNGVVKAANAGSASGKGKKRVVENSRTRVKKLSRDDTRNLLIGKARNEIQKRFDQWNVENNPPAGLLGP